MSTDGKRAWLVFEGEVVGKELVLTPICHPKRWIYTTEGCNCSLVHDGEITDSAWVVVAENGSAARAALVNFFDSSKWSISRNEEEPDGILRISHSFAREPGLNPSGAVFDPPLVVNLVLYIVPTDELG